MARTNFHSGSPDRATEGTNRAPLIHPYRRAATHESTGWGVPREGRLWLLAAVVFWLIGWYKGINLILLLAYLMAILWAGNVWLCARSLRGLSCRRHPSGPVHVGESIPWTVSLAVLSYHRTAGGFFVEERLSGLAIGWFVGPFNVDDGVLGSSASNGSISIKLRQHLVFSVRGVYVVEPLRVGSRFPFGLVHRSIELEGSTEILVLPSCGQLDRRLMSDWLIAVTSGDGRRHTQHRLTTLEADLHGLRPYRPGDSPRWIHWRTTARRGERMVREFELPDSPDLRVVIDPMLGEGPDVVGRLESAISLAATICREWGREPGLRVGLTILDGTGVREIHGLSGEELSRRMLESLARTVGRDAKSTVPLSIDGRDGSPVLVITTEANSTTPDRVEAVLRRPVARVDASGKIPWYNPPSTNPPST